MINNIIRILFAALVIQGLLGCSYLEKVFPDKERDYQYTTEIPMLNWPPELRKNQQTGSAEITTPSTSSATATNNPGTTEASTDTVNNLSTNATEAITPDEPAPTPIEVRTSEADDRTTIASVEIIKYDDGENRLRLGTGFQKAWRAVNKALSRNAIEVTERNHDQGQFAIQYDPDEKKAQDDSFFDELTFLWKGINANDEKYFLKLEENQQGTDVMVFNEEHVPLLNNDAALRLLKVLASTINADVAKKSAENPNDNKPSE
jgi:outer membrane protein assembly factor BamC